MPFIQLQFRRDLSSNWTSNNPTLAPGELGIETDTNLFKIGTGVDWVGTTYGGLQGLPGATGETGTNGVTGTILFAGSWDINATYNQNDLVSDNGSMYYWLSSTSGNSGSSPSNDPVNWGSIALPGPTGATGETGPSGTFSFSGNTGAVLFYDGSAVTGTNLTYSDLFQGETGIYLSENTFGNGIVFNDNGTGHMRIGNLVYAGGTGNRVQVFGENRLDLFSLDVLQLRGATFKCRINSNYGITGQYLASDGDEGVTWKEIPSVSGSSGTFSFSGNTGAVFFYDGSAVTGTNLTYSDFYDGDTGPYLSENTFGNGIVFNDNGTGHMRIGNIGNSVGNTGIIVTVSGGGGEARLTSSTLRLSGSTFICNINGDYGVLGQYLASDGMDGVTWKYPMFASGETGPTGETGTNGVTGTILFAGSWDINATYNQNDLVSDNGSMYYWLSYTAGNSGDSPSNDPVNWGLIALPGPTGPTGIFSFSGNTGTVLFYDGSAVTGTQLRYQEQFQGVVGPFLFGGSFGNGIQFQDTNNTDGNPAMRIGDFGSLPEEGAVTVELFSNGIVSLFSRNTLQFESNEMFCVINGNTGTTGQYLGSDGDNHVTWKQIFSGPTGTVLYYDGSAITGSSGLEYLENGLIVREKLTVGPIDLDGTTIAVNGQTYLTQVNFETYDDNYVGQLILHRHSTQLPAILAGAVSFSSDGPTGDVSPGTSLFQIAGLGYIGDDHKEFASIVFSADDKHGITISNQSSPGKIDFNVSADGQTNMNTPMRIRNDSTVEFSPNNGNLLILNAPIPASRKGATGDLAGMFSINVSYFYYCFQNYTDGTADIWNRTAQSSIPWS